LAKLCLVAVNDTFDKEYFENFENINFKEDDNIKYKLSFEKIMRMYKNAVENGFASYAEA
jgi:5-methylcytosine-specific restriction protein B